MRKVDVSRFSCSELNEMDLQKSAKGGLMPAAERERGFTLIELLIVVAIIGILASVSVFGYFKYVDKARLTMSVSVLESVRTMLAGYQVDHGNFPVGLNFDNCTDLGGNVVFDVVTCDNMKKHISAFVSYDGSIAGEYVLKVKAKDSAQTIVTVTEQNISH
ncbi:type IV pilin protein [Trichloromonas sp.]|uniref:type IV pilin protein n=1 Tax=Trichloromonas sp. TaxID=3069249 RepID=UPI003D814556